MKRKPIPISGNDVDDFLERIMESLYSLVYEQNRSITRNTIHNLFTMLDRLKVTAWPEG